MINSAAQWASVKTFRMDPLSLLPPKSSIFYWRNKHRNTDASKGHQNGVVDERVKQDRTSSQASLLNECLSALSNPVSSSWPTNIFAVSEKYLYHTLTHRNSLFVLRNYQHVCPLDQRRKFAESLHAQKNTLPEFLVSYHRAFGYTAHPQEVFRSSMLLDKLASPLRGDESHRKTAPINSYGQSISIKPG